MSFVPRRFLLLGFVLSLLLAGVGLWLLPFAEGARAAWVVAALPVAGMVARDTWRVLRGGSLGVDIIALVAILGAIALDESFTAALVALMVAGGGALEEYAQGRARGEISALLGRVPQTAHLVEGDGPRDVAVAAVRPGDVLLVKPGEMVPVDGRVLEDGAELDEAALTGEAVPVARGAGDLARSGGVNAGGPFRLRAAASAADSTYAAIVRMVRSAEGERAPLVRLADRWALWFLPLTLAVSGFAWLWHGKAEHALAVLVVATPCPLILAVPVAIIGGVNRAARRQVIVRHGGALEALSRVTVVAFDKTGTLTVGRPRVQAVDAHPPWTRETVLRLAGAVETGSSHLLARTLVEAAHETVGVLPAARDVHESPGDGVRGHVEGHDLLVGSRGFLAGRGVPMPSTLADHAGLAAHVAIDGRYAATVVYADEVRAGVPAVMRRLEALGARRTLLLSGDRQANASAVAADVGIAEALGDLSPADKVREVKRLVAAGERVLMVGDGTNDAPALAAATVGIALASGHAGVTAETADAVILVDDVSRVADAVAIGQRTMRVARQSVAWGLGLSAAAMVVAAAGRLPPAAGALVQEAIDIAVILNAVRAAGGGRSAAPRE